LSIKNLGYLTKQDAPSFRAFCERVGYKISSLQ
jgi:hypothetical protein